MTTTDRSPRRATKKEDARRYIRIPPPKRLVVGINPTTREIAGVWELDDPEVDAMKPAPEPQELEFVRDFVRRTLLNDQSWGTEVARIYMAMDLRTAFHGKQSGDVVALVEDEWEALCEVVRKPARGYVPALVVHFGDWLDAILEADKKPPTEVASEQPSP